MLYSRVRLGTPYADPSRVPKIEIKSLNPKWGWKWGVLACVPSEDLRWREESVVSPALPSTPMREPVNYLLWLEDMDRERMVLEEIFIRLLQMIKSKDNIAKYFMKINLAI